MSEKKLEITTITHENSKKYGMLIDTVNNKPCFDTSNFSFFKNLVTNNFETEIGIGVVYLKENSNNMIEVLEYHKNTNEIIIPTEDIILILSLPKEVPILSDTRAFFLETGKAFMIHKGVWHYAPISLERKRCSVFVLFSVDTPDNDVYKVNLQDTLGYNLIVE